MPEGVEIAPGDLGAAGIDVGAERVILVPKRGHPATHHPRPGPGHGADHLLVAEFHGLASLPKWVED